MSSELMFCPDINGFCIEEKCMAFQNNMIIEIQSGNMFIRNAIGEKLDYNQPMTFSLIVGGCSKYEKVTDKDSFKILENFKQELEINELIEEG
jgi:hypothetical protein